MLIRRKLHKEILPTPNAKETTPTYALMPACLTNLTGQSKTINHKKITGNGG